MFNRKCFTCSCKTCLNFICYKNNVMRFTYFFNCFHEFFFRNNKSAFSLYCFHKNPSYFLRFYIFLEDRKRKRLTSIHFSISFPFSCLKKKNNNILVI